MALEDRIAGKIKKLKGRGNDTAGAARGKSSQQVKGKLQKAAGAVQDALGKADSKMSRAARDANRGTVAGTRRTTTRRRGAI